MASFNDPDSDMYVTKRNQQREIMSFDKILKRIKKVGQEANIKINYTSLAMKVIDQLYDGIATAKIDELTAEQCASLSSTHPDYNVLAGRITVSNHHKNTKASFYQVMKELYNYKDQHGNAYPLISQTLYKTICAYGKEKVDSLCVYDRDYLIDFFGLQTAQQTAPQTGQPISSSSGPGTTVTGTQNLDSALAIDALIGDDPLLQEISKQRNT